MFSVRMKRDQQYALTAISHKFQHSDSIRNNEEQTTFANEPVLQNMLILNVLIVKLMLNFCIQRCIYYPVKHLQWSF